MTTQHHRNTLDPLLLERLAETGFLASECGLHDEAETIFAALATLRPGNPSPLIGLSMVRARRGSWQQAIEELRRLVADYPDSAMAKAVLGMMLLSAEQAGALPLFEQVLARDDDDPNAVQLATACIDLARQRETAPPASASASLEHFRHYNIRP